MTIEEIEHCISEDVSRYPLLTEWIHENEWGGFHHEEIMNCLCNAVKAEWVKSSKMIEHGQPKSIPLTSISGFQVHMKVRDTKWVPCQQLHIHLPPGLCMMSARGSDGELLGKSSIDKIIFMFDPLDFCVYKN